MRLKAVFDADGLIKLGTSGILEVIAKARKCLIPQAVYTETVVRGIQSGYPDAPAIRQAIGPQMVRPRVRHIRAAELLKERRGLGRGEEEVLHLFFAVKADVMITDDAAFVALLESAGVRYMPPALVLVALANQGYLEFRRALEVLERMSLLIRAEVYRAARADLESLSRSRPERTRGGRSS